MNITEVRIKAMNVKSEKLKAFASITIDDDFVVRDLKIIVGSRGLFVAMPSRKLSDYCPKCRGKNQLRSKFCNDCGTDLRKTSFGKGRSAEDEGERSSLHADIAHPVNSECRDLIQEVVVKAYKLAIAFPDNRGIFTSEEIATLEAPEEMDAAEVIEEAIKEVTKEDSCEEPCESCCCSVQPEEVLQQATGDAVVTPVVEESHTEQVVDVQEKEEEKPVFEPAAKQTSVEERSQEKPKKKRRFGLGIFS